MSVGGPPDPAIESVAALIGDMAHVVREIPRRRWTEMAEALSSHHSPPIDDALLSAEHGRVQAVAHDLLRIGAACDDFSQATYAAMNERVEELVERWNASVGGDRRLLVAERPAAEMVIDLRVDDAPMQPSFIEPPPPPKWPALRRLSRRLR